MASNNGSVVLKTAIPIFFFLTILGKLGQCGLDKDLTITFHQKLKLDKFRDRMESILPHDYMKKDIYLIRWLRAKNFDLDAAEKLLLTSLEWRRKEKMDGILNEDWTDHKKKFKFFHHGFDKEGQPVAVLMLGSWNVREEVLAGGQQKLLRYLDYAIQLVCNKPRELRAQNKTVTQIDFIVDLRGFSMTQQGCLQCLPLYIGFVYSYENYFPGCADKIVLINTPTSFEFILSALRPIFSQQTRNSLEVYGVNKNLWKPILHWFIDKDQLPAEMGGNDERYEDEEDQEE